MNKRKTLNKGVLLVVSSPSGAGKTTVVTALLKKEKNLVKTISHTTRKPRPGEKNRRDYYFVSRPQFKKMKAKGEFLETAHVYGNDYGTSKKTILSPLKKGKDVVLVIEEKGARAIRKFYKDAQFVLILPPSLQELKKRITHRKGMTSKDIQKRIRSAKAEIKKMGWYKHRVVNDRVSSAAKELRKILKEARN